MNPESAPRIERGTSNEESLDEKRREHVEDFLDRNKDRVEKDVLRSRLIHKTKEQEIDFLTGASSLRKLERRGQNESETASYIFFDVDHFKNFNSTYGHAVGDEVLKEVVAAAKRVVRAEDEVFRKGGEEFVIVCPQTSAKTASEVAERVREAIQASPITVGGTPVTITASFGVAEQHPGESQKDATDRANQAMRLAKDSGRNRVAEAA